MSIRANDQSIEAVGQQNAADNTWANVSSALSGVPPWMGHGIENQMRPELKVAASEYDQQLAAKLVDILKETNPAFLDQMKGVADGTMMIQPFFYKRGRPVPALIPMGAQLTNPSR